MRAVVSERIGGPESLVLGIRTAQASLGEGEVRIAVKAVGLNYPDLLIIEDKYQFKPERPFSPGGELAGIVTEVGAGVSSFVPGDRVSATTLWGALAEEVIATEADCVPLPDSIDFVTAAALSIAHGTAYYALKTRGDLAPGETLLVLGASGGIGLAAVELGRALGARVIAAASSQDKLAKARAAGADEGFLYPVEPEGKATIKAMSQIIKEISGGGVDVTLDPVGGTLSEASLRSMNWGGRHLVVGFPAGIPSIPMNLTLLKSCDIRGVFWAPAMQRDHVLYLSDMSELFGMIASGRIKPHIHATFPLEQSGEALALLQSRTVIGKVVVTVD